MSRRNIAISALIAFAYLMCLGGVYVIESSADPYRVVATEANEAEVCFPASAWGWNRPEPVPGWYRPPRAEDRPCYLISRPYEDGSGHLILGTLGADAARCVIPNVFEERGRFTIQCHRFPNR